MTTNEITTNTITALETNAIENSSAESTANDITASTHLYFAYGSNLSHEQMEWRCPDASPVGAARLDDWSFRIGGRGYATISPTPDAPGAHVWGGVWEISDADLASLDVYEGVRGGLYRHETVTVHTDAGELECIVYVENYDDTGEPTPRYIAGILTGAEEFALPSSWIAELEAWATAA